MSHESPVLSRGSSAAFGSKTMYVILSEAKDLSCSA
jgi:hypothetical protein